MLGDCLVAEFGNNVETDSQFPGTQNDASSVVNSQLAGIQLKTGAINCPDAKYGADGSTGPVKCDPVSKDSMVTVTPSVRTTCAGVTA
jgi:hypothetical protein